MVDIATFIKKNPAPTLPKVSDAAYDWHPGLETADPYRAFETLDPTTDGTIRVPDAEAKQWVEGQEKRFQKFIEPSDDQAEARMLAEAQALKDLMNFEYESLPEQHGSGYFSYYQDGESEQRVYRVRKSLDDDSPRVLIDPNTKDPQEKKTMGETSPSPDGKLVAYTFSQTGNDGQTIRVRDVTKEPPEDLPKDIITGGRWSNITWDRDSSEGFYYNYPSSDIANKRLLTKFHKIGTHPDQDKIVFDLEVENTHPNIYSVRNASNEWGEYEFNKVIVGTEKGKNDIYFRKHGTEEDFQPLLISNDFTFNVLAETNDGKLLVSTNHNAPNNKIVLVDPLKPDPVNWQPLPESNIQPHDNDQQYDAYPLKHAFAHKGKLFLHYTVNGFTKVRIYDINEKHYSGNVPIPEGTSGVLQKMSAESDTLLFEAKSFKEIGRQYQYNIANNEISDFRPSKAKYNLNEGVEVKNVEVLSRDGETKIPMVIIRRKDVELDGTAATMMTGYGGFGIPSIVPGLNPQMHKWVSEGGIWVQAGIRGGDEQGQKGHDQGRLHNKHNVFNDFADCGQYLIDNNYTKPSRLAIKGQSNGGLLVLATAIQNPDLFGAVIANAPVTDMLGYHRHTYGSFWKADYGDPEKNRKDFEYNLTYSPLHTIKANKKYAPTLINVAENDNRVVRSHGLKVGATMQEKSPETLCFIHNEDSTGHGFNLGKTQIMGKILPELAFLERTIGPINQKKYKISNDNSTKRWVERGQERGTGSKFAYR